MYNQDFRGRLSKTEKKYKQPSVQENFTEEQIKEKLKNYEQVDDIDFVGLKTHVRYFII